jgi:autotransporter translocation and assembly factor TamB
MDLEASVIGFALGQEQDLTARLTSHVGATETEVEFHLGREDRNLVTAHGSLPARFQLYPVSYSVKEADLQAEVRINDLPIPWELMGLESQGMLAYVLNGQLTARGTARHPWMYTDLHLHPSDPELDRFRLDLEARIVSSSGQRSALGELLTAESLFKILDSPPEVETGLTAVLAMSYHQERAFLGTLAYPISWSDDGLVPDDNRPIAVHVRSDSLTLAELNPLLPAGLTLGGKVNLVLDIEGPIQDPGTSGRLRAENFTVSMTKGGRILGDVDLAFAGSARKPRVEGKILIDNGLIPVPEAPRSPHPAQGESMLWAIEARAPDTTTAEPAPSKAAPPDTTTEPMTVQPQLDVEIVVPRALWIRGRKLEVELSGRLRLVQEDRPAPTVIGELRAERGSLNFLGRNFQVEPGGEVSFYGDDEFDPSLNVSLSTRISSYRIIITLQGTVERPELILSSEPELSEGDIMSVLVFGETMDKLDGDQTQLVAQRAAAIAATYGSAELAAELAGPLGVDMLQINPAGSGQEGASSVTVGKYLSPRTLLKYEQALDSGAGFFVTLQYLLTRTITLETLVGTRQSGAQVNWIKDY